MYEHIYWAEQPFTSFAQACPELMDRTVTINGVSKCYAMTGWRIGYAGGPTPIIEAMKKIQGQSTSNPCSISQAASVAALNGDQACVTEMVEAFKRTPRLPGWRFERNSRLPAVCRVRALSTPFPMSLAPSGQGTCG